MRVLAALLVLALPLAAQAPSLAGCPALPADNIWNQPVDKLPKHRLSDAWVTTVGPDRTLHPDFGSGLFNGGPVGIPFITVGGAQAKVRVTFEYADESDAGPYPVPRDAPIEGGAGSSGDRHVLVVDHDNCILYELFSAYPQTDGSWRAGSGAIFNLRSNALRPAGWTSADAAGLPIVPGLARYEEVAAGEIRHALRLTVPQTQRAYVWPARHFASRLTGDQYPPMGARFRLRANYDISGFSPETQVILRALKKYGLILADNGSSWFISGAPDERWNNDRLRELRRVRGADLEAVDASVLMIDSNSGRARRLADSVTNGASFLPAPAVPGQIVSIFGTGLGPSAGVLSGLNSAGLLATEVAGVQVLFDGTPAPLIYVSATQINAIVPYAMAGKDEVRLETIYQGVRSAPVTLNGGPAAPAIFTADFSGTGPGAVFHPDWGAVSATRPAEKGAVVVFFATGEGQTEPAGRDGLIASSPLPAPKLPVSVSIGGANASILYAGAAPGQVAGLMQVNARVPETLAATGALPLVLTVGGVSSRGDVTVSVR